MQNTFDLSYNKRMGIVLKEMQEIDGKVQIAEIFGCYEETLS